MGARWVDPALARWSSADTIVPDPSDPQSLNRYSYVVGNPLGTKDPSGHTPWWLRYCRYQLGVTYYSGFGLIRHPLLHGRNDVRANATLIRESVPSQLALIVAASIAHQASDPKDRPYGTDVVEVMGGWVKKDQSVGIAQLRPGEVERWAPDLVGGSLYDPEVAVRAMTGKLLYADQFISGAEASVGQISLTDRYMLLALAQNCGTEKQIQDTVTAFFAAGGNWYAAFGRDIAITNDWKEQLRLIVLHLDWLILNGWELPEGVDLESMRKQAFED